MWSKGGTADECNQSHVYRLSTLLTVWPSRHGNASTRYCTAEAELRLSWLPGMPLNPFSPPRLSVTTLAATIDQKTKGGAIYTVQPLPVLTPTIPWCSHRACNTQWEKCPQKWS